MVVGTDLLELPEKSIISRGIHNLSNISGWEFLFHFVFLSGYPGKFGPCEAQLGNSANLKFSEIFRQKFCTIFLRIRKFGNFWLNGQRPKSQ